MIKQITLTVLGVLVVAGALVGTKVEQFQAMAEAGASMVPPPEVVTAATVRADEWEHTLSAVGSLAAVQGVVVRAEVSGRIVRIGFESGAPAEAGGVLVELDASAETAQLRAAEAAAKLAGVNLRRTRELRANNTTSAAELDAANAQFAEAEAQVDNIRATIAKKTIRAPFSGRLGIRRVDLGQVLSEGDAIASLQTLDPIHVDFSVPQRWLAALATGSRVRVTTDAAPGETYRGTINAVSPEVDPVTRNVALQATIANDAEKLRPGMFASVEVVLGSSHRVLSIPVTAVLYAPYGDSVFVVEEHESGSGGAKELIIRQRFVRIGTQRGDFVAVVEGLEEGERVVSSGVFKLRSGMKVVIDNSLAPEPQLAPKPENG